MLALCRFVYDSPLTVGRLVAQVADKSQRNTQRSWKRPYGVGLLVAGHDQVRRGSARVCFLHCCAAAGPCRVSPRTLRVTSVLMCHRRATSFERRPHRWTLCDGACDALWCPQTGPHLYQTCPSGSYYEYKAIAIGARSQARSRCLVKAFFHLIFIS